MKLFILVIEKQEECENLINKIRQFLPDSVYETVFSGNEAVETAKKMESLDLVFLDMNLPFQNSILIAQKIWKRWKHCQIIFLTEYQDFKLLTESVDMDKADYLLKPISQTGLEAAVRKACEKLVFLESIKNMSTGLFEKIGQPLETDEEMKIKIQKYLSEHLSEDISLEKIGAVFGTSGTYFCKRFKRLFNKNFVPYLTWMRLEAAKKLLVETDLDMNDIAWKIGFCDAAYFIKVFRKEMDCTPYSYRRKYKNIAMKD